MTPIPHTPTQSLLGFFNIGGQELLILLFRAFLLILPVGIVLIVIAIVRKNKPARGSLSLDLATMRPHTIS